MLARMASTDAHVSVFTSSQGSKIFESVILIVNRLSTSHVGPEGSALRPNEKIHVHESEPFFQHDVGLYQIRFYQRERLSVEGPKY